MTDDAVGPDRFLEAEEAAARLLAALDALKTESDSYKSAGQQLSGAASQISATLDSVREVAAVTGQAVEAARGMGAQLRADMEPIAKDAKDATEGITALKARVGGLERKMMIGIGGVGLLVVIDIALRFIFR